jgi:hypothetical protein
VAGCDGAVFGTGVCGTPEPDFGVAGLFCAKPAMPTVINMTVINIKKTASDVLGERCIEFKGLRNTLVLKTWF